MASFATSYIPTGASQTTRAADVATIQGSNFYSWYNRNVGTIQCNYDVITTTAVFIPVTISAKGGANNSITMDASTNGRVYIYVVGALTGYLSNLGNITANKTIKHIMAYEVSSNSATLDGATVQSASVTALPAEVIRLGIGIRQDDVVYSAGHIKSISYYPQRLSDSVLKGLTA